MSNIDQKRKKNNDISESLTEENMILYTDFVCYLRVSALTEEEQEEIISDVLLMFLEWQQQGKGIEDMVGGDLKRFADDVINAINPHKNKFEKVKENLLSIIEVFFILLTIDFVLNYLRKMIKWKGNIIYDYNLGILFTTVIIIGLANCVINYIGKNSFKLSKKGKESKIKKYIFGVAIAGIMVFMILILKYLKHLVLFSVDAIYVAVIIGIYWIYKLIHKVISKYMM